MFPFLTAVAAYQTAIASLRVRLADLDRIPIILDTYEPDPDSTESFRKVVAVNVAKLVTMITDSHNLVLPCQECGMEASKYQGTWKECEHGRSLPHLATLSRFDRHNEIDALTDRQAVCTWLGDGYDPSGYLHVVVYATRRDFNKAQREVKRQELETSAAVIAQEHNVSVNSLDFIKVVRKEIRKLRSNRDQWNSAETRMEEWMDHRFCGSTDGYFSDLNYENGRYTANLQTYRDILSWLSAECPLLWAQYQEMKLRRRNRIK